MHDIRYNEVDDEVIVPSPFADAILVFRGGANGQEAPIRIIQGPNTQIGGSRLAIDTKNREIFVPGGNGGIVVLPLDGNGDVRPKRVLRGPDTQLGGGSLSVDPLNNLLVASGRDESIVIFDRMASGNTKPLRVIKGPNTQIDRINQMQVYPEGKLVIAAMPVIIGGVIFGSVHVGLFALEPGWLAGWLVMCAVHFTATRTAGRPRGAGGAPSPKPCTWPGGHTKRREPVATEWSSPSRTAI